MLALKADGSITRVEPDSGRVVTTSAPFLLSTEAWPRLSRCCADGRRQPERQLQLLDVDTFRWLGEPSRTEWGLNVLLPGREPVRLCSPTGSGSGTAGPGPTRRASARRPPSAGLAGTATLGPGVSISYLPDSSGLLVASADGRSWTVDTRTSAWLRRACRIAGRNLTRAEWRESFPDRPYQVTCKQWPAAG